MFASRYAQLNLFFSKWQNDAQVDAFLQCFELTALLLPNPPCFSPIARPISLVGTLYPRVLSSCQLSCCSCHIVVVWCLHLFFNLPAFTNPSLYPAWCMLLLSSCYQQLTLISLISSCYLRLPLILLVSRFLFC